MTPEAVEVTTRRISVDKFDDAGLATGARDIFIHLPGDYFNSSEHYQVVYVNDGQYLLSDPKRGSLSLDLVYDSLLEEKRVEPTIFVGVASSPDSRMVDFRPIKESNTGNGLEGYYRFLTECLKPYIDTRFRTKQGPQHTAIAGYSLGGLAAFLMAYEHHDTFAKAGCLSPSLCRDNHNTIRYVRDDDVQKKPACFWLDGGGGEYDTWKNVAELCDVLEHRGWRLGEDFASYFDYEADHDQGQTVDRLRGMLVFLLGAEKFTLTDYKLVPAATPELDTMDLGSGYRRIIGAEARYSNEVRLTVPNPKIVSHNISVAQMDDQDPILVHSNGPGLTSVSSEYSGYEASLPVIGCDPEAIPKLLLCPQANGDKKTLSTCDLVSELPHEISDINGLIVARIGTCYDENHIHIVVSVTDSCVIANPCTMPGNQDSVGIALDPRPKAQLIKDDGYSHDDWSSEILVVCLSPGVHGEDISIASQGIRINPPGCEAWAQLMPIGTRISGLITPSGYEISLSIPIQYLERFQHSGWQAFRLNVWVNKVEIAGGHVEEFWWFPHWVSFRGPIGSGVFKKS